MQEAPPVGGWSSAVIADVVRGAFYDLDAAPVLISGDPTPIPYAGALEEAWLPSTEHLVKAVEKLCGKE